MCRVADDAGEREACSPSSPESLLDGGPVALDPERDLYGELLFHRGRFRRVSGYRRLSARQCLAEITQDATTDWFSRYMPAELLLGDPGARDATIHAIQACIPQSTLLPVGVDRLQLSQEAAANAGRRWVSARERERVGRPVRLRR